MSCAVGDIVSVDLSGRPHREYGRVLDVAYVDDRNTQVMVKVAYEAWGQVKTTTMRVPGYSCRTIKRLSVVPKEIMAALELRAKEGQAS